MVAARTLSNCLRSKCQLLMNDTKSALKTNSAPQVLTTNLVESRSTPSCQPQALFCLFSCLVFPSSLFVCKKYYLCNACRVHNAFVSVFLGTALYCSKLHHVRGIIGYGDVVRGVEVNALPPLSMFLFVSFIYRWQHIGQMVR